MRFSTDCTFWFTTEYLASSGWAPWLTKIVSFQLPGCSNVPTPSPTQPPTGERRDILKL